MLLVLVLVPVEREKIWLVAVLAPVESEVM